MNNTKQDGGDRVIVPFEEAVKRLPDKAEIHTFRNPAASILVGADWSREEVIAAMRKHQVEETGPGASKMNHGLAFRDAGRWVFVETVKVTQ